MGNQRAALAHTKDRTPSSLMARVLAGGVLAAVVLTVFARLAPGGNASTTFSTQNLAIRLVSGILYVAIMTPWVDGFVIVVSPVSWRFSSLYI